MPQNMGGRDLHQPEFVQPAAPEPPPPQEVAKPSPYSGRTQGHTTVYNAGSKGGKGTFSADMALMHSPTAVFWTFHCRSVLLTRIPHLPIVFVLSTPASFEVFIHQCSSTC